ncbi:MAG TPA: hypothetical protein VII20_12510 [Roseiarcus sp.]|jgi:hypothetical protein
MSHIVDDFQLGDRATRYSLFVPRLYNYCLSLGFKRALMMPSRAFCSDESQGYPVILLTQHFGAFPFDHGRVGGKVATNRHGPHAHHGEDLIILQASHVGYDPGRHLASIKGSAPPIAASATIAASSARCCIGIRRNMSTPARTLCWASSTVGPLCSSTIIC